MKRLADAQWEALFEGTLRVMQAEDVETFAQESLGCIAGLVPAKQYMLFTFKRHLPGDVVFGPAYTFGSSVHYLDDFLGGPYMNEDWIFNRMTLKQTDCAYRDSDIIDEEAFVKMRVYRDIYQRDGVHYGMRVNMVVNNQLAGSYSIFRAKETGDFSDQELELCNKLAVMFSTRYKQLLREDARQDDQVGLTRAEAMDRFGLTTREYQVAERIAKGCAENEVAEALSVSDATVRKHLYNAYAKLAVNKRSQLEEIFR